jgi:energy-coupling factor transporter ATP-binding protein EcfA2
VQYVLRDVSFRIPAGKRVGICGRTGAGKSTLVTVLLRLAEPELGSRVDIDGLDIFSMGLGDLRSVIAVGGFCARPSVPDAWSHWVAHPQVYVGVGVTRETPPPPPPQCPRRLSCSGVACARTWTPMSSSMTQGCGKPSRRPTCQGKAARIPLVIRACTATQNLYSTTTIRL